MSETAGVIHDIGYKRYTGARLGRAYAVRSLYAHSLRTAFGFGRTGAAKVFPWILIGILTLVAAILTIARTQAPPDLPMPVSYWDFPNNLSILLILFCATIAPELVSRDLRGGVLPLYFSRPLTRSDYALAKYAALASALFLMVAGPQLLMFVGGAFSLDDVGKLPTEVGNFAKGLLATGVYAILFAALALLIASLAGRRAVAAALVVAIFIITTPIYGVLMGVAYSSSETGELTGWAQDLENLAGLVSPMTLASGVISSWFGGPAAEMDPGPYGLLYAGVTVGVVVVSLLLLLLRYRKVAR